MDYTNKTCYILQGNKTIKKLNLSRNNIGETSGKILGAAVGKLNQTCINLLYVVTVECSRGHDLPCTVITGVFRQFCYVLS